jgi:hypothetical protein
MGFSSLKRLMRARALALTSFSRNFLYRARSWGGGRGEFV